MAKPKTRPEEIPANKKINSFSGDVVDKHPLLLAPSPADQRILSQVGDKPLVDLCNEVVASIGDDSGPGDNKPGGPSTTEDSHPRLASLPYIPETRKTPKPEAPEAGPVQHEDVPPTNAQLVEEGAEVIKLERPPKDDPKKVTLRNDIKAAKKETTSTKSKPEPTVKRDPKKKVSNDVAVPSTSRQRTTKNGSKKA